MALSLLQEQAARGISVRPISNMKHEPDNRRLSVSPPMNNNNSPSSPYAGMHHHHHPSNPQMGLLTSGQILAANHTAALLAAGIPMSLHATFSSAPGLFNHHHSLFSSWPHSNPSPPSPMSPALSAVSPASNPRSAKKHNNNNVEKKPVKRKVKKEPEMHELPPLSPPTSGSSPDQPQVKEVPRDKSFTCKVCSRSFGYKHVLQNHERTHTGEKPFECPECHKRFTRDHHLKTHMRLHTGEKPYHCSHCDRDFVQVANLRRHLRVHTGERPYSCEMCQARFSDSNQLKAHVLIHNNEKPFECERCRCRFRRRHHLLHHKCTDERMKCNASDEYTLPDDDIDNISASSPIPLADKEKRGRKSSDIRRVIRLPHPHQAMPIPMDLTAALPEQTEPEDLSMSTGMANSLSSVDSPISRSPTSDVHHEDDLEDLDDAATLFLKQRQAKFRRHFES